jgi:hypothetical protein
MQSFLIYHKQTKNVIVCMKQPTGTILTKEAICNGMGYDPDEYDARFVDLWMNTTEFKRAMYVNEAGETVDRPRMTLSIHPQPVVADGKALLAVDGLPANAVVTIHGTTVEVTDGRLELTFDTPGEYQIKVSAYPYIDYEDTIHAH